MSPGRSPRSMDFMMNASGNMAQSMSGDFVQKFSIFYLLLLLLMIAFFVCMEDYHLPLIPWMK